MSIYDKFKTEDELLAAVRAAVKQENSEYFLEPDDWQQKLSELQTRYDVEKNQHIKTRNGVKEAEKRVKELELELSEKGTYIAELEKRPETKDLQQAADSYAKEIAAARQQAAEASKELPELRERIAKYEADAMENRIQTTLRDTCKKLGIWDCAISDILYRAKDFEFADSGVLVKTDTQEPVSMVLEREMKEKPNWQAPSQGGTSNPGKNVKMDPAARKAAAEKLANAGDYLGSLRMLDGE